MTNNLKLWLLLIVSLNVNDGKAQQKTDNQNVLSQVWVADNGDGTYKNPIINADYSDPDVIRVGNDYYMTASSFNCVPGLPILHSKDMVNWKLIGHALPKLSYADVFGIPQHGNGVYAPCIRYHKGEFYIFFPDPDFGIFMVKAVNPAGPWSYPVLVRQGKGFIDPSPLWDEDGKAYLVYAFAGSRSTLRSVLMVCEMAPDGTCLFDNDVVVFDGHEKHPTVEGPKFYKRNGYYYIFAPGGGVYDGWQLALRSKNVYGPYQEKIVLEQGSTQINGPHQGAWVDTPTGQNWFFHFQDKMAYGRVVHLQPMRWEYDWPIIGIDYDKNGIGEPVSTYRKPDVGQKYKAVTPQESDEFNTSVIGLQWQWHANPQIAFGYPSGNLGYFRLNCFSKPENYINFWALSNLLLQKFPSEEFIATTKITFNARINGDETGFVVMGENYQYISLKKKSDGLVAQVVTCENARLGGTEKIVYQNPVNSNTIYFRIKVKTGAICSFSFSNDGKEFIETGNDFKASPGRWIGAKIGFFALREKNTTDSGSVDIDWIRFEKND